MAAKVGVVTSLAVQVAVRASVQGQGVQPGRASVAGGAALVVGATLGKHLQGLNGPFWMPIE